MSNTMFIVSMNRSNSYSIFAGNLPMLQRTMTKSSQEKAERQQKAAGQIDFWEKQKESLKKMECDSLEDIAKKLEMLQSYEDEIANVKAQYNQEQMHHLLDEARELGEKIAKAAEKMEPKTAEERREEMAEEALGTDETKSGLLEELEEMQEEISEMTEEMTEKAAEEVAEMTEEITEEAAGEIPESASGENPETLSHSLKYKRFDLYI